jgi:hypothetical protein
MRRTLLVTALLIAVPNTVAAQPMRNTIAAAEAEGAAVPPSILNGTAAPIFMQSYDGTPDRKCAEAPAGMHHPNASLRSGEFILRSDLISASEPVINHAHKILWWPLHNPYQYPSTLLLRAVRLSNPGDSLRISITHWAWNGTKQQSAFPSSIRFPSAGTWLVIATAGSDWGCFVLPVP